ncbi:MAG: hypothetical protein AABZ44_06810 [Elusimicrobiota bacterium]
MRILTLALIAATALPLSAEPGRTGAAILSRDTGIRASALGGSGATLQNDVESVSYNPAAMTSVLRPSLLTSYSAGFGHDNFGHISLASKLVGPAYLGLGFGYFDAGDIHLNLSDGTRETRKAAQDYYGNIALGFKTSPLLSFGGAIKPYALNLANQYSASGMAYDSGALLTLDLATDHSHVFYAATTLRNLGTGVRFIEESDPLPMTSVTAGTWQFTKLSAATGSALWRLNTTLETRQERRQDLEKAFGLEIKTFNLSEGFDWAALRLGAKYRDSFATLSLGVAWCWNKTTLNYALIRQPRDAGLDHRLSLEKRF